MKGQSTKLKKSTMYTSDNWSLSRIYKELTSEIIKKENKTNMGVGVMKGEHLFTTGECANWYAHIEISMGAKKIFK